TILLAEKYRRCRDNGSLYDHGNWNVPWMALFAYGSRNGAVGYTSNSSPNGVVGAASRPMVAVTQANCNPSYAVSPHTGGINVVMADGSVKMISGSIDGLTWWALTTPNAGDIPTNY